MARKVAIAGVSTVTAGPGEDVSPYTLHFRAAAAALADAGLGKADVDGLCSAGLGALPPIDVAEFMGLKVRWIDSTMVGGATWEVMAAHAADAIVLGHADVVLLVYAATPRADIKHKRRAGTLDWGSRGPFQYEVPFGHSLISKYAMAARRHMHEYGTTIEQLAQVAVSMRANAAHNVEAAFRSPITIDEVQSGPMIADPFTRLHCCIRSDGGAAVVLVAEDRMRDLRKPPVWVIGSGEAVSHVSLSEWPSFTTGPAAVSGPLAFARAGIRPDEIQVAAIYDAFSYMLLLTLEDLGFCAKGEAGPFVASGALELGGALPTNPDGGGMAAAHPGMRGLYLLVEAARQLRGECGARQVPDARLACVSGTGGWFCSSGTMILAAD